jgi:hypothetical protein
MKKTTKGTHITGFVGRKNCPTLIPAFIKNLENRSGVRTTVITINTTPVINVVKITRFDAPNLSIVAAPCPANTEKASVNSKKCRVGARNFLKTGI